MPPPATCATSRRWRPEAYPKGRPHPQDPKGGAGATPRHTALRRGEGGRWPTRRAAPTPQDPKGGADANPRHPAPRRGEGARRPTQRAAPTVKKVTPHPSTHPLR